MPRATRPLIERPVILLGAPRSGTTLLLSVLASSRELWSLYREGETVFRKLYHPSLWGWQQGNRLLGADLSPGHRLRLHRDFYRSAVNLQRWLPHMRWGIQSRSRTFEQLILLVLGRATALAKPRPIRLIEKTPKNSLRVPFLDALFDDAYYVLLKRDGRANVASLIEGWQRGGHYRTYDMPVTLDIEGYSDRRTWTFVLPPGWEEYASGRTLAEVCAFQYVSCNQLALADLQQLPQDRVLHVRYEDLVSDTRHCIRQVCDFVGIRYADAVEAMAEELPVVNAVTQPEHEKWKSRKEEIDSILPAIEPTMRLLGYRL